MQHGNYSRRNTGTTNQRAELLCIITISTNDEYLIRTVQTPFLHSCTVIDSLFCITESSHEQDSKAQQKNGTVPLLIEHVDN